MSHTVTPRPLRSARVSPSHHRWGRALAGVRSTGPRTAQAHRGRTRRRLRVLHGTAGAGAVPVHGRAGPPTHRPAAVVGVPHQEHGRQGHGADAEAPVRAAGGAGTSDFAVLYPTAGLALPRLPDAEVRRATCRAFNIFVAEYFGVSRTHHPGRRHSHAYPRRGHRGAGVRHGTPGPQGDPDGQSDTSASLGPRGQGLRKRRRPRRGSTRWASTARTTTIRYGRSAPSWGCRPRSSPGGVGSAFASPFKLRIQPHRPLRVGWGGRLQGAVPWRSDSDGSGVKFAFLEGRGLGVSALRRPPVALGEAQAHRARSDQSRQPGRALLLALAERQGSPAMVDAIRHGQDSNT